MAAFRDLPAPRQFDSRRIAIALMIASAVRVEAGTSWRAMD
jgi:hypothetical protein